MPVNGLHEKISNIEEGVQIIKNDLSESVRCLSLSIDSLTNKIDLSINSLTNKIDSFMTVAQTSIPIKAVFLLLAIMVLGLVGIEGVKQIGPVFKFLVGTA